MTHVTAAHMWQNWCHSWHFFGQLWHLFRHMWAPVMRVTEHVTISLCDISPLPRQEGPWRWPYLFTSRGLSSTKHHTWQTQDILHFSFHPVSAGETAHFNVRQKSSPSWVFAWAQTVALKPRYFPATSVPPKCSRLLFYVSLSGRVFGYWGIGVLSCVCTLGVCLREITVINCLYSDCTNGLHTDCAGRPSCHWAGDVYFWKFLESV